MRRNLLATTALTAILLAGCATSSPMGPSTAFSAPKEGDDGVVIAETAMVPGVSRGNTPVGTTDDCTGPGLGVTVQGSTGDGHFLFDKNGEPCDAAQTLFDGRSEVARRQTDPAINLTFHDKLGPLPDKLLDNKDDLPGLKPIPEIRLKSELLPNMDPSKIEPAAGPSTSQLANKNAVPAVPVQPAKGPDPLVATLATWDAQDNAYASRSTEADAAAGRQIASLSKTIKDTSEQDTIAKLAAQLRERERQVQEEQRRHAETLERAQENRQVTTAARQEWQQKENDLEASLTSTQQRLAQYQELSNRLAADKAAKEKGYQDQIATLSSDLKAAEAQADTSRRELVLQAAAKIAEAEQLAHAAQLQEQDIKLREAARLKSEAETMMDRALAIKAGNNVIVNGMGAPAVPMALMDTPVVLHANKQTLPEILTNILQQAKAQTGEWKADWQLSGDAQSILKEKWSLTAEAPLKEVLAQLQQQIKAAHGITLTFTQFGQSRLLVVTDTTPPVAQNTK